MITKIKAKVDEDLAKSRSGGELSGLRKSYRELLKRHNALKSELDEAFKLKRPAQVHKIEQAHRTGTSEATAFIVASDWHIEEEVKPETVNHLNHFNLEIAKSRIDHFFQNSLTLLRIMGRDVKIQDVVLCLLGDFITGSIHEEFLETNQLRPGEAIWTAQNHLVSGIKFYLEHTRCNLIVVCKSGNHSRMTPKTRFATESGNSLEIYMYKNLARIFEGEKRVRFVIDDSYHTYLTVYDKKVRVHHGHAVKYAGGVGGIYIPMNKAIAQWDKGMKADLSISGHYHQQRDGGNFISNGSLIGYNAYAVSIKAEFEPPKQTFFLLDRKRGKTVVAPIILEEV